MAGLSRGIPRFNLAKCQQRWRRFGRRCGIRYSRDEDNAGSADRQGESAAKKHRRAALGTVLAYPPCVRSLSCELDIWFAVIGLTHPFELLRTPWHWTDSDSALTSMELAWRTIPLPSHLG